MAKSKKKKSSVNLKHNPKKQVKKSKIILGAVLSAVIITALVILIIYFSVSVNRSKEICNYTWIPESAQNSSGDEVEMSEIYNTNYSTYQGSLNFNPDGSFSFWMTPGDSDDGTHSGKFFVESDDEISAEFDDGTKTTFKIMRKNGTVDGVLVNYGEYKIYFTHE